MAVTMSFQYMGQQVEMDYWTGKNKREGGRNVVILIQSKNEEEHDLACELFIEKMAARGWDHFSGFGGEGDYGKEGTSYWHPVNDKDDADYLKDDYLEVKKEVVAELKARKNAPEASAFEANASGQILLGI